MTLLWIDTLYNKVSLQFGYIVALSGGRFSPLPGSFQEVRMISTAAGR